MLRNLFVTWLKGLKPVVDSPVKGGDKDNSDHDDLGPDVAAGVQAAATAAAAESAKFKNRGAQS